MSLAGYDLYPPKTHDFKGFRPDFNRIVTGPWPDFNWIPWNLVKIWLKTARPCDSQKRGFRSGTLRRFARIGPPKCWTPLLG